MSLLLSPPSQSMLPIGAMGDSGQPESIAINPLRLGVLARVKVYKAWSFEPVSQKYGIPLIAVLRKA